MASFQGHTKNGTAHQFNVISGSFARLKGKIIYLTYVKKIKEENMGSFQGHTKNGTLHQLSVIY